MDWLSPFFMSSLCCTFYRLPFLFPRPWPTISLPTLSCPYITSLTEIYIRRSDRGSTHRPTLTTRTKFHFFKKSALWAPLLSFYYEGFSSLFRFFFAVFFPPLPAHIFQVILLLLISVSSCFFSLPDSSPPLFFFLPRVSIRSSIRFSRPITSRGQILSAHFPISNLVALVIY